MTGEKETRVDDQAEVLLSQLMHLKTYEKPETARMTRNKQNILREIRNSQANRRKSLGDLLELNMPWFFAEPKYGVAALFIAFMALQYAGMQTRTSQSTGIYTSATPDYANSTQSQVTIATNRYPQLPTNRALFETPGGGDGAVLPAGFKYRE